MITQERFAFSLLSCVYRKRYAMFLWNLFLFLPLHTKKNDDIQGKTRVFKEIRIARKRIIMFPPRFRKQFQRSPSFFTLPWFSSFFASLWTLDGEIGTEKKKKEKKKKRKRCAWQTSSLQFSSLDVVVFAVAKWSKNVESDHIMKLFEFSKNREIAITSECFMMSGMIFEIMQKCSFFKTRKKGEHLNIKEDVGISLCFGTLATILNSRKRLAILFSFCLPKTKLKEKNNWKIIPTWIRLSTVKACYKYKSEVLMAKEDIKGNFYSHQSPEMSSRFLPLSALSHQIALAMKKPFQNCRFNFH